MVVVQGEGQASSPSREAPGRARRLCQSYPAVASAVPAARESVSEFAAAGGADVRLLDSIRLAVSETVGNVVRHAYPDSDGSVQVDAWLADGDLWVLVADCGCGLHADRESDGLGQGLALIQRMADELWIVSRSSGGTEVRMRFVLATRAD